MTWTRRNGLITGCSNGRICLWTSEMKSNGKYFPLCKGHDGHIININLSPGERYLVTTGVDQVVKTWSFPNLEINYEIKFDVPIKVSNEIIISYIEIINMVKLLLASVTGSLEVK